MEPDSIPKYQTPLIIPPAMPRLGQVVDQNGRTVDYYEIAVQQFQQHILPPNLGLNPTTVWSYGAPNQPATFNYPAFTVEAHYDRPVRIKWINDLVDAQGRYLPHLLPVDQTLHWANPPGGLHHRDRHGMDPTPYRGPMPIVTHVHGAHTTDESDGYTEAWYLPAELGVVNARGRPIEQSWDDHITEMVALNATEIWELHNFTVDAHPIHIHEVMFEVVNRENKTTGEVRGPEAWETGVKDTVIAYPDEITRIKARFDLASRYVWHCHSLEHEDNEMMRPYAVGVHRVRLVTIKKGADPK